MLMVNAPTQKKELVCCSERLQRRGNAFWIY
jgi:hypothetical protein